MLLLRTFGGLSLETGGRPVVGAAAQRGRLAILAVLAVAGNRGVSRDRLYTLFWPESDTERARGALKQALYALRRDVGEQDLTLGTTELRLNPASITSDVATFERALAAGDLKGAVAAYAGPFLDGIYLKDLPEFERWVERERQRFAHAHREALERLAGSAQERGDAEAAVRWWRQAAAIDPLSARVARAYMEALAAAGDREAAIRHGRVYAELTRTELGADPDPSVAAFTEQLRVNNGSSSLNGIKNGAAAAAAPTTPAAAAPAPPQGATASEAPPEPPPVPTASSGREAVAKRASPRGRRVAAAAAATLVTAATAIVMSQARNEPTVVVLVPPFENATGDTALGAVTRMAADWVTQGLAHTGLVQVVDFRSALRGATRARDDSTREQVVRESGATRIVRGVVYRRGDSLTIRTRIVDAEDGTTLLEVDPVSGPASDPRALLDAVRQRMMGGFAALSDSQFAPWARAMSQPPLYEAYHDFVAGLEDLAFDRYGPANERFLTAARLDTNFVQAKLFFIANDGGDSYAFRDSLIRSALAQRERLTPYDRASLDRVIAVHRGDLGGALLASRRLTSLAPGATEALVMHAVDAVATNRFSEALRVLHRAGPPKDWGRTGRAFWAWDTQSHHLLGDHEAELAEAMRAQREIANAGCSFVLRALAAMGREASVDSLYAVCQSKPGAVVPGSFHLTGGREYLAHGHREAARRAFERARQWYGSQRRPWREPLLIIDWSLGNWSAVRDYWREKLAAGPLDARGYAQLGAASAHLGDTATARAMAARIAAFREPGPDGSNKLWRSIIAAALGERAEAVSLLREASAGGEHLAVSLHAQPGVAPLRGYAPFEALLRSRD